MIDMLMKIPFYAMTLAENVYKCFVHDKDEWGLKVECFVTVSDDYGYGFTLYDVYGIGERKIR